MLFGYPINATQENWLRECVVAAVESVHQSVQQNKKRLPAWPEILPMAHRTKLAKRTGLKDRLGKYAQALRKLDTTERQTVLDAISAQNKIPELLTGQCECLALGDLPEAIREPAKSLFTFTFKLLSELGVRQRQYKIVCDQIPQRVCPFCGCENLEAPNLPQEDLDHYLPRSKYPFAAANLRNLAPMGGRCNSSYKLAQDPLRQENGTRRLAFDPFSSAGVDISFENSVIDELTPGPVVQDWVIDFAPTNEAVKTWDEIFHIRERWTANFLDEKSFKKWLKDFGSFCKRSNIQIADDAHLVQVIKNYQEFLSDCEFEGQAFLKAAAFQLFFRKCEAGSARLLPLFRDLV